LVVTGSFSNLYLRLFLFLCVCKLVHGNNLELVGMLFLFSRSFSSKELKCFVAKENCG